LFTSTLVIQPPDRSLSFEIICDVSDYVIGVILEQRKDKKSYVIYYTGKTLNSSQMNYSTTKKKLLAVVFSCEDFRSYLVGSSIIVFSDYAPLKYFLFKKDSKALFFTLVFKIFRLFFSNLFFSFVLKYWVY